MDPELIVDEFAKKGNAAMDHLAHEFSKLQIGRANAALVEGIMVDSYGSKMPLKAVAGITIPEFRQIAIQPWSRDMISAVEKAILEANIGLTPQNNGVVIRLNIPQLTGERRRDLVKVVHKYAEDARITLRNERHEALARLKTLEKNKEAGEDLLKAIEKELQSKVDDFNRKIEEGAKKKEADVMTI